MCAISCPSVSTAAARFWDTPGETCTRFNPVATTMPSPPIRPQPKAGVRFASANGVVGVAMLKLLMLLTKNTFSAFGSDAWPWFGRRTRSRGLSNAASVAPAPVVVVGLKWSARRRSPLG